MADKKRSPDDFWDLSSLLPKKRPPVMRQNKPDTEPVTVEIGVPEDTHATHDGSNLSIGSLTSRFREVTRPLSEAREKSGNKPEQISIDPSRTENAQYRADINKPSNTYGSRNIPRRDTAPPRTPRPTAEPLLEYEPDYGLVRRVRIMRWPTSYTFYEQFRTDAIRCHSIEGKLAPRVEFFSYTPQYRQMSQVQLEYYFYWRSLVRRGEFEPADFSYILLYVYEIINLHDSIDAEYGLNTLCELWIHYRDPHKALDKYLAEWVADYCLIHQLPPPCDKLSPIMHTILELTSFREFYMSGDVLDPETLISLSSNYCWQKSKYAKPDDPEVYSLYKTHITEALHHVIEKSEDERFTASGMTPSRVSRDAFCGSLCAHNIKRRIDIEYLSYSRSHELRLLITDIVKYSENKLRAHLGIKSRLRVDGLDEKIKAVIDDYFYAVFPNDKRRYSRIDDAAAEERYYDAMYGALSVGVDTETAQKIEAASWSVTDRLTVSDDETHKDDDAIEGSERKTIPTTNETPATAAVPRFSSTIDTESFDAAGGLSCASIRFLYAVRHENDGDADRICREASRYADDIAVEINDFAADTFGDIFIEDDGSGHFRIIEDYESEIDELLGSYNEERTETT